MIHIAVRYHQLIVSVGKERGVILSRRLGVKTMQTVFLKLRIISMTFSRHKLSYSKIVQFIIYADSENIKQDITW